VKPLRRLAAAAFIGSYRLFARAKGKSFSLFAAGSFASFGARSVLEPPIRLRGEERIVIGSMVFIGANSWLQVLDGYGEGVALTVGDGTNIVGGCVLSAARSITIGRDVLMARNVYISDHSHAFSDTSRPVIKQGITAVSPVVIGDGAWLGQNVLIGPGVRIGRGAVIGANSVVLSDVADYAVAAGVPARVIRRFAGEDS
jgi:acetyltransferase-like isoleucine patch superfamily enzyme